MARLEWRRACNSRELRTLPGTTSASKQGPFQNVAGRGAGEVPLPVKVVRYGALKVTREGKSGKKNSKCKKIPFRGEEKCTISIYVIVIIEEPKIMVIFILQSPSLICNICKNNVAAGACSSL
jgi:hypothetical protein